MSDTEPSQEPIPVPQFKDMFKDLGMQVDTTHHEPEPLEQVRAEVRKYEGEVIERAYNAAVAQTQGQLQYASAKHLAAGLYALLGDIGLTFVGQTKKFMDAPAVSEVIQKKLGPGKNLVDLITSMAPDQEQREKARAAFAKVKVAMARDEKYWQNVADYAEETGKPIAEILRTPEDKVPLLVDAYGGFDNYKEYQERLIEGKGTLAEKLDGLSRMPISLMLRAGVQATLKPDEIADLGLDVPALGLIAQDYVHDLAVFGKAFFENYQRGMQEKLQLYEVIAEGN